eukprot:TRINITY_DN2567_c0_g1_i1.p1 TRINITY_DN2567_c0_g1~~TRINITY_DN2567_c0_g1_i1.p1  ORF type:complete len:205 (+),score=57.73 TRINITY_DN2567_c0_g1_i1:73-687(+)
MKMKNLPFFSFLTFVIMKYLLTIFTVSFFLSLAYSFVDPEIKCAACRKITENMITELKSVDPTKYITIGWRIDSNGNRIQKKVPLARSHEKVGEVMDELCDDLNSYGVSTDEVTGKKVFQKIGGGGTISGGFSLSQENVQILKSTCEKIAGTYEDEISELIYKGVDFDDLDDIVCIHLTHLCDEPSKVTLPDFFDFDDDEHDEL